MAQLPYWDNLLEKINVLPFDKDVVKQAVIVNKQLKQKRKQIDLADLFIAATAIANNLPFATLNRKHFERIDSLDIVEQGFIGVASICFLHFLKLYIATLVSHNKF